MKNKRRIDLEREHGRSHFRKLNIFYYKMMTMDEIHLLTYLTDRAAFYNAEIKNDGWFHCKVKQVCEALNIEERTQYRLFEKLITRKYITTCVHGCPPKRLVRINWELLSDHITEHHEKYEKERDKKRRLWRKKMRRIGPR